MAWKRILIVVWIADMLHGAYGLATKGNRRLLKVHLPVISLSFRGPAW